MWYVIDLKLQPDKHIYKAVKLTKQEFDGITKLCKCFDSIIGVSCTSDYHEGKWCYIPVAFRIKKDVTAFIKFLKDPNQKIYDVYGKWVRKD